jgi:hypothetical protein
MTSDKHPTWKRMRVGKNRVRWVAYDDKLDAGSAQILAQGYASSLPEADAAARAALSALGLHQARRSSSSRPVSSVNRGQGSKKPAIQPRTGPREYLYTRRQLDTQGGFVLATHLVTRKTARRIYVSRASIGPDQIGTEDEAWRDDEPSLSLDRAKLERDGSVYASGHRTSNFYKSLAEAAGEIGRTSGSAFRTLGIRPPASLAEIKAAYRRKALEAHPDRGGDPETFQAVERAYRRLAIEADADDSQSA